MTAPVNSEMIRLARVSRGKHQAEVAEQIGIRQPTYSKIENGQVQPSVEQLEKLAKVLAYPTSFFGQTDRVWGTASPHHRKRKSLSPAEIQELEAQLNVIRLNVRRLIVSVAIEAPFRFEAMDLDEVGGPDEAARQLRRLWRIPSGPIVSVVRIVEDAGGIIIERPFPHDRFDAISVWGPGEQPVILLNASFPADRKRHTLAHEIGHLVLHASDVTPDPESEADAFAQELLTPAAEIRPELKGLRLQHLPDLKRRWKVSMRSLVYRARELGEITKDQARYLFIRLNQEYGAKRERIELPAEVPTLIRELVDGHLQDLGYSLDELASLVNRNVEEFRQMYGPHQRHLRVVASDLADR